MCMNGEFIVWFNGMDGVEVFIVQFSFCVGGMCLVCCIGI